MDIEIRTIEPDEFDEFVLVTEWAFSAHPVPEEVESRRELSEPERSLVAVDGREFVGTAVADPLTLSVPGGEIPMAGVSGVGVTPTHRRRGILTSLMRCQLDAIRGVEPVAGLWASEGGIYGRFGYGCATLNASFEIERHRGAFIKPPPQDGRIRLIEKEQAFELFPPIFERVRPMRPGFWDRSQAWWRHLYLDLESQRQGAGPLFYAIREGADGPDGYVSYRVKQKWDASGAAGTLTVRELMAATPEAYVALWRYCLDVDLMAKVSAWGRPPDEPLFHLLAEPRQLGLRLGDGLWIRVVDVERALSARAYSAEGRIALEIHDAFCPWTEGRYVLEVEQDGAECRRADVEPDLVMEAADLGAAFLGGTRLAGLARAGRVVEEQPGALRRADAMFQCDPPPWCPAVF